MFGRPNSYPSKPHSFDFDEWNGMFRRDIKRYQTYQKDYSKVLSRLEKLQDDHGYEKAHQIAERYLQSLKKKVPLACRLIMEKSIKQKMIEDYKNGYLQID